MAMASMSMVLNRPSLAPLQQSQPALNSSRTRRSNGAARISCSAAPKRSEQCAPAESLGRALVPFVAVAALVGSTPMLVEAVYGPPSATAAEVETTNIDAYKELLQKIKEKRGRQGYQAPAPADAAPASAATFQPEQPTISPAAARLKEAAERARQEKEAERLRDEKRESEKREAERREEAKKAESRRAEASAAAEREKAAISERERAAVEKVVRERNGVASITIKKKTHGFLPLFVSQFFFLLATLGVGALLFVLPEENLKEIQDKVDDAVAKATPVAEDVYAKAKPLAEQAWVKAQEASVVAKPYVEKAWIQAKPLAAKAVEASKPLLKEAQVKANELLQEAQKKAK